MATEYLNLAVSAEVVGTPPYQFRRFIGGEEISHHMRAVALRLREDYRDKDPIFVGVLNGCFIFMADLIREVNIPCEVDFIKLSSYRETMTAGEITLLKDVDADIRGRHVILVEDIVDTGNSLEFLRRHLRDSKPASLVVAAMFVKPGKMKAEMHIEYVGMNIPDEFVVGYGLDYAQQWRQLSDLFTLVESSGRP